VGKRLNSLYSNCFMGLQNIRFSTICHIVGELPTDFRRDRPLYQPFLIASCPTPRPLNADKYHHSARMEDRLPSNSSSLVCPRIVQLRSRHCACLTPMTTMVTNQWRIDTKSDGRDDPPAGTAWGRISSSCSWGKRLSSTGWWAQRVVPLHGCTASVRSPFEE